MKIDIEALANEELAALNDIVDEVMQIPDSIFRQYGAAFFTATLYRKFGAEHKQDEIEARLNFEKLCDSVPQIPRGAIQSISMAYGTLTTIFFHSAVDYQDEQSLLQILITVSMARGMALGELSESPSVGDIQRKTLLSMAGLRGAESRKKPYAAVKTWALEKANEMRGDHKSIARKLASQLPKDLATVSNDPVRLIYDALRSPEKSS